MRKIWADKHFKHFQELVSTIDFRYITDVLTKEEAIKLLKAKQAGKQERIKELLEKGYPAYTTQVGMYDNVIITWPKSSAENK